MDSKAENDAKYAPNVCSDVAEENIETVRASMSEGPFVFRVIGIVTLRTILASC